MGLGQRLRHDHALAGGQAVGLDDDGRAHLVHIGMGRHGVGKGFELCRGDRMALHEGLGKSLGTLQLRSGLGRAKNTHAVGAELVHHASRQRAFRADHSQGYALSLGPFAQCYHVADRHIDELAVQCGTAVARCDKHLGHAFAAIQLPGQSMFTSAIADY